MPVKRLRYRKSISEGLSFGLQPHRWLPVFVLDAAFFSTLAVIVFSSPSSTVGAIRALSGYPGSAQALAPVAVIFAGWFLLRVWVTGSLIHQSRKGKEFALSWRISSKRYPSLLGAILTVVLVGIVAGLVPFISQLLSLLVGIVFFFSLQAVMLRNRPAIPALKESWSIFMRHLEKVEPSEAKFLVWVILAALMGLAATLGYSTHAYHAGHSALFAMGMFGLWFTVSIGLLLLFYSCVFRAWLSIAAISGLIAVLFSIPVILVGAGMLTPDVAGLGGDTLFHALMLYYLTNPAALIAAGTVFVLGSSISTAFSIKTQTEFYLQLRKRFGIL